MDEPGRPCLTINYGGPLDLRIECLSKDQYHEYVDYRCSVHCRLKHPTGFFDYSASDVRFDSSELERFATELSELQSGKTDRAVLGDPGPMFSLRLRRKGVRNLWAELYIRESLIPSLATLSAEFEVEYDLYVNKLLDEFREFIHELQQATPQTTS